MKSTEFNRIVDEQLDYCKSLLTAKGQEYTPEGVEQAEDDGIASDDRLRHFKKAAVLMNCTPIEALMGMMSKHTISVADMCTSGDKFPLERWVEKITDSMNYLLLLEALVIEEDKNEKY